MLLRETMAMGATWKTKADAAGRSDATPHLCGIFPSCLFSSVNAIAESEQGMRPVAYLWTEEQNHARFWDTGAVRIRSLAGWRDRRPSPMALAAQKRVPVRLRIRAAPPPFRVMSCNDVPVFWDDHCEYRDIFKKALT